MDYGLFSCETGCSQTLDISKWYVIFKNIHVETVKLQEQFNEFEIAIVVAVIKIFFVKEEKWYTPVSIAASVLMGCQDSNDIKLFTQEKSPMCVHIVEKLSLTQVIVGRIKEHSTRK